MTDPRPLPKLSDVMQRDTLVKESQPIKPTQKPATRWNCTCVVCHIDWQQKIIEKRPEGRCPRCGSDRFGYSEADE